MAGVAQGTWQAWHFETSTFVSRDRRRTYGIGLALVARSVPTCRGRRGFLCGRRGTWRYVVALCVAGAAVLRHPAAFHVADVARVALGWLWLRARFPHVAVDAAAFCVALGNM